MTNLREKKIIEQYSTVIKTNKINQISIEGCEMVKLCSNFLFVIKLVLQI